MRERQSKSKRAGKHLNEARQEHSRQSAYKRLIMSVEVIKTGGTLEREICEERGEQAHQGGKACLRITGK